MRVFYAFFLLLPTFFGALIAVESHDKTHQESHRANEKSFRRLKILVHTMTNAYSHLKFQLAIADALADAGHEVHILRVDSATSWSETIHSKRATKTFHITIPNEKGTIVGSDVKTLKIITSLFDGGHKSTSPFAHDKWEMYEECLGKMVAECKNLLQQPELLEALRNERYDVGLAEPFDECIFGVFHAIGVRTRCCATLANPPLQWILSRYGVPIVPSFVSGLMVPFVNALSLGFVERAINFYNIVYESIFLYGTTAPLEERLFREILSVDPNFPSIEQLARDQSLIFINSNEFFELPRPLSNKIIHIGGIVSDEGPNTPAGISNKSIERFLNESDAGAVLVSFGSLLDPQSMPDRLKHTMVKAFARFPRIRFLWKFVRNESDTHENALFSLAKNVRAVPWLEQNAVLNHPNVRAFVTHCGQNSANEAAWAGVPVVGVPLFGEQRMNAANLKHKGVGMILELSELLSPGDENGGVEQLVRAIDQVLNSPDYAERARLLKRKLLTVPFSPRERLVRWVEFAAQFPDLVELNLPRPGDINGGFIAYYSLDVLGVFVVLALFAAWIVWKVLRVLLKSALIAFSNAKNEPKLKVNTATTQNKKAKCS